ncbi:MAG: tripartite tricarboxylate transporter permease [Methanobacteriaceae archaeon]|nr:tripartite tricarboxylate transporter permease [Methanobacteriaceae archaeon]
MIDLILIIIIGTIIGTITGILPGIHVNTVGLYVFSLSDTILTYTNTMCLCTFFVTIAIVHAMLEFIPSLVIGVPDESTALTVLPAHRLLFEGRACEVIRIVAMAGFLSIIIIILLMPVLAVLLPLLYNLIKPYVAYILIIVILIMVFRFNNNIIGSVISLLIFLVSGIMGWLLLNSSMSSSSVLLCLLTGLFGTSSLIYSMLHEDNKIPKQEKSQGIIIDKKFIKGVFAGSIAGCILGLLPGLGPAQGSVIAQSITGNDDIRPEDFLITNSGVNVSDTLFSLIAIYLIGNPRSSISVFISYILYDMNIFHLMFLISVSLVSVSLGLIISLLIGDKIIEFIEKINYLYLSYIIIFLMSMVVLVYALFDGVPVGFMLLCYITSVSLGLIPHFIGISKSNLMGVLILPSIIMFLGF